MSDYFDVQGSLLILGDSPDAACTLAELLEACLVEQDPVAEQLELDKGEICGEVQKRRVEDLVER